MPHNVGKQLDLIQTHDTADAYFVNTTLCPT